MARSLGFGSNTAYLSALLRLAFASAPSLQLMVSVFYFTPLPGFFSPFPLGTCSLSVTREYLALRDGPRGFRQDFTCPALLRILQRVRDISLTGFSPSLI